MNKSKKPQELNRRELIKKSITGTAMALGTVGFITSCTKSEESSPKEKTPAQLSAETKTDTAEKPYVSEESQIAKTLDYKENAAEASRVDKGETKAQDQFCNNCQFYKAEDTDGNCALFPNKLVKSEGWCKSWSLAAN